MHHGPGGSSPRKTACEDFVDRIVQMAKANNTWLSGPDINQRRITGIQIADTFIPHDHLAHRILGSAISPADHLESGDISGFKPELVAGGQHAEAYRHIGAAMAAVLEGLPFLVDLQNRSDAKQLQEEEFEMKRKERRAELADNEAGKLAGEKIRDYLNEKIGLEELRSELLRIFCSE